MSENHLAFSQALVRSLVGERGHLPIARALPDITPQLAGKSMDMLPYTIYQLIEHLIYWQEFMLTFAEGGKPQRPTNVMESWSEVTAPRDEAHWNASVVRFLSGVDKAVAIAQSADLSAPLDGFPGETVGGILRNIASHNSYHLGEIVLIRRLNGAWPPPGGGFPA